MHNPTQELGNVPSPGIIFPAAPAARAPSERKHDLLARQRAVVAMGRRAIAPPKLSILMQDAAALLAEMLDAEYSGVAEVSPHGKSLRLRVTLLGSDAAGANTAVHESAAGSDSLAAYVLQVAHPVVVPDLRVEKRFLDPFLRKQAVRSALAVPLILQDRSFGALAAYSIRACHFDDDDVLFAETIAHLVATTIARTQAEDSLAQERRLSSEVLQTVEALVLMLDSQWQITHVNPACERMTGFSLAEVKNRPLWSVFAVPEEIETFRGLLERLSGEVAAVECESRLLTKHAEKRHIAWSCRALFDQEGELESVIATGIDITRQREAERLARRAELAASQSAAGAAEGEVGTFGVLPLPLNAERRRRPRRSYPYTQLVAFIIDGKPPRREEFVAVRCNDIAAGGFSFFCPTPPASDALVVALGTPPKFTYMTAQVAHVTRKEHQGRRMFLIGCNYTGRATY